MAKLIKLKVKPQKPTRSKSKNRYSVYNGEKLKSIIDNVPDNAEFNTTTSYYDSEEYFFEWEEEESESDWLKKLNRYNQRLEEYNKWYIQNKENKAKKIMEAEMKKEKLEKELEKLNKILK